MEFFGRELVSRQTQMIQHDLFKSKNYFMKLARGVPVDTEGFPIFKQFLKGEHSYLATRFATILLRTDLCTNCSVMQIEVTRETMLILGETTNSKLQLLFS